MKNYYIERYITLYNKGEIVETQKAEKIQVPDEITGRALLLAKKPNAVINDKGFSIYEGFVMVIKDEERHYKRLINEITPQGTINNL